MWLFFLAVAAFGTYAFFIECYSAKRATFDVVLGIELGGACIYSTCKGYFGNVEFIFQQLVNDFYHTFGHGLLGYYQTAIGVCRGKLGFEGRTFNLVLGVSVADSLLFVNIENCLQQRVVLTEYQCMVEILQNFPCYFLYFITGINHVYSFFNGVFYLDSQCSGVSVKILRFSLKTVKTVAYCKSNVVILLLIICVLS